VNLNSTPNCNQNRKVNAAGLDLRRNGHGCKNSVSIYIYYYLKVNREEEDDREKEEGTLRKE
jgi:hypothetical protein